MLSTSDSLLCREAGLGDQLDGSAVRLIAEPADLDQLRRVMAAAYERGLTVLPRGSGGKLSWLELPPVVDVLVDLSAFTFRYYDHDGPSLTAGAGAGLAPVQDELARHGRRLGIDAPSLRATLGGIMVTGEEGPLSHEFGPPTSQILDAVVVLPDGTVTSIADRATMLGPAVFDLGWAYAGWPSAASIVAELRMRTHPLPSKQLWLTMPVSQPIQVGELRDEVLGHPIVPSAAEFDLPGMTRGAVPPQQRFATGTMSVLLEGSDALERAAELTSRLDGVEVVQSEEPPVWWGRYPFRSGDVALRLQTQESGLHLLAYVLADAAGSPVPVRGGVGTGHGWAGLPADMEPQQLINVLEAAREVLLARGGTAVVQSAPSHLRELLAPYRTP